MDPVTHAVAARMAASIGRPALSRWTAALAVVAGLAPDVDAVLMPVGWDVYLRVHESGTHSLLGAALLAALLAALTRRISGTPYRPLLEAALAGVVTHIVLDVVSGAIVQPAWPFMHGRTTAGLVAMADPWLAVPLAAALLAALVARWRIERVTPAALAVVAAILALKLGSRQMADTAFRRVSVPGAGVHDVHAQWGSLTRWWIYEKTADRIRMWNVDGWRSLAAAVLDRELARPADMIAGEASLATVRNFLLAHDLPVREALATPRSTIVYWSDLRFCFAPDPRAGPPPGGRLRPTNANIACGVWFGGEISPTGHVLREFVTIGDYVQER